METRSVRTPLSIKIAVGFFFLGLATKAFGSWMFKQVGGDLTALWFILSTIEVAAMIYQILVLPRLSRWAPIVQVLVVIAFITWRYIRDPNWTDNFPLTGVFVLIIPLAGYLALVLPHWRKMNWAPLGLPYRAAANPADVF